MFNNLAFECCYFAYFSHTTKFKEAWASLEAENNDVIQFNDPYLINEIGSGDIDDNYSVLRHCIGRGCLYNVDFARAVYYDMFGLNDKYILDRICESFIIHDVVDYDLLNKATPCRISFPKCPSRITCERLLNLKQTNLTEIVVSVLIFQNWHDLYKEYNCKMSIQQLYVAFKIGRENFTMQKFEGVEQMHHLYDDQNLMNRCERIYACDSELGKYMVSAWGDTYEPPDDKIVENAIVRGVLCDPGSSSVLTLDVTDTPDISRILIDTDYALNVYCKSPKNAEYTKYCVSRFLCVDYILPLTPQVGIEGFYVPKYPFSNIKTLKFILDKWPGEKHNVVLGLIKIGYNIETINQRFPNLQSYTTTILNDISKWSVECGTYFTSSAALQTPRHLWCTPHTEFSLPGLYL
jgi:hypothetical protein